MTVADGTVFEVFKTQGATVQPWRFRARARNGQVIFSSSEGYFSKWNVKRAIKKIGGNDAIIKYV